MLLSNLLFLIGERLMNGTHCRPLTNLQMGRIDHERQCKTAMPRTCFWPHNVLPDTDWPRFWAPLEGISVWKEVKSSFAMLPLAQA